MDDARFDSLARTLAGVASRRSTLTGALGGLLVPLVASDETDARKHARRKREQERKHERGRAHDQGGASVRVEKKKKKKKCKGGTIKCGKTCFNVSSDPTNCGGCGVTCTAGQVCQGGACTCNGGACAGCNPGCAACCDNACCAQAGSICHADTGACCVPESKAQTCDGKCEGIINNCGVKIDCGPCTCEPNCPACQRCNVDPRECVADPTQQGSFCGTSQCVNGVFTPPGRCNFSGTCEPGIQISCAPYRCDGNACRQSCDNDMQCVMNFFCNGIQCVDAQANGQGCDRGRQCVSGHCADGVCCDTACDSVCKACNLAESEGACTAEPDGSTCGADGFCDSGQCLVCDVCADGCSFSTIQAAINAASPGDTLLLCPGAYGRSGDSSVAFITKSLTLVGAGQGDGGAILDGGGVVGGNPVLQIVGDENAQLGDLNVELRDLQIKGGNLTSVLGLGGGVLVARATATLKRVRVTGNFAELGGGIGIHDVLVHLTLTDTVVTQNTAAVGGGIYNDGGTLILAGASSVNNNTPNQCVNASGGTGCPA